MLELRILKTIQFFHLQDIAPTAFEVYKYLVSKPDEVAEHMDLEYNLAGGVFPRSVYVSYGAVMQALIRLCSEKKVVTKHGFYMLPGKEDYAALRRLGYVYGVFRQRRIRRFGWLLDFIPFLRSVAVGGSQALGLQKKESDIDLLVVSHPNFLWLARVFTHFLFHMFGVCRHGAKIANRFCLNHYVAGAKLLDADRNLFRAFEYARLTPVLGSEVLQEFRVRNEPWMRLFLPNWSHIFLRSLPQDHLLVTKKQRPIRDFVERVFNNSLGMYLENSLGRLQLYRIMRGEYVIAEASELAFHPDSRKNEILSKFYQSAPRHIVE